MDDEGKSSRGRRRHKPRKQFQRLSPEDCVVWEAWLRTCDLSGCKLHYDVRVGTDCGECPSKEEGAPALWERLKSKRADVVVESGDEHLVVEIKPRAGMVALGQVLTYRELYKERVGGQVNVGACVCCGVVDADVARLFATHGVAVWRADLSDRERERLGL